MSKFLALVAFAVPTLSVHVAFAQTRTFKAGAPSQIQFVSDAPLERITGITSGLRGEIVVDPNNPATAKAELKVDTSTLKTGNDLRDEHLRGEKWLDAARFPATTFVITKVSGIDKLKPNDLVEPTVTGKFTLHGVTREITTKAKVRFTPAAGAATTDTLRVKTSFTVHLEDYKVSIPSIVALKVSPDIQVNIDMHATADAVAQAAPEAANAPAVTEPAPTPPAADQPKAGARKKPATKGAAAPAKKRAPAAKP